LALSHRSHYVKRETIEMTIRGDKPSLLQQISATEAELAELKEREKKLIAQLQSLRAELTIQGASVDSDAATGEAETQAGNAPPLSPEQKIDLFRQLFRGRTDVYPQFWVNTRSGKKGYSPACSNEWRPGICDKPRIKCSLCPSQAFLPVTAQVILDHLQGRHTIGVYPLLADETCWFLAVDFDKAQWRDDVTAFAETCRASDLPCAIERSRSGNGAHVWFFFAQPVPAAIARQMGCFLITETMSRRDQLDMTSYDRVFPNQDTMPSGGFGNLIALPLQFHPRQEGNALFLDDDFEPHVDQWEYLSRLPRIEAARVAEVAAEAASRGQVIGLRIAETGDEEQDLQPWLREPSRKSQRPVISEPIPPVIHAVLSQRLYVEKAALPSPVLNAVKRLAAFQNPEFYKKQSLRLSTALTPRVIYCAEDYLQHVSLPRGCRDDLDELLRSYGSKLVVEDLRVSGNRLDVSFRGALTNVQAEAATALLQQDTGVLVAPPGTGKTVLGIYLLAARQTNTLILVHRQPLIEQWKAQLEVFLGVPSKSIGQIGGGKRNVTGLIDLAMVQSLARKESVDEIVAQYGQVIVDECHHLPAVSFERVLSEVKARYVVGLTATPHRRDGHQPILHMQLGPTRHKVDPRIPDAQRPFRHRLVLRHTDFELPENTRELTIQEIYGLLACDESRNTAIIHEVLEALREQRSPILLTERKQHLEILQERLRGLVEHIVVLHGGRSAKERRAVQEQLESIPESGERLLLATGRFIGEGFDDARLDTLFLALPVAWKGTLVQYAGRLHRTHPSKLEVRVVDFVDDHVPMLARMFEKRLRGYRAMGYRTTATPEKVYEEFDFEGGK